MIRRRSRTAGALALVALATVAFFASCATPAGSSDQLSRLYPAERPYPESRFSSFGGILLHYRI